MRSIIAIILIGGFAVTAESTEYRVPEFDVNGVEASYAVALPPDFDVSRKWPLILDFHGATSPGSKGANLTRIRLWSHFVEQAPYIVVGINGRSRSWGTIEGPLDDGAYARHVLDAVLEKFPVDPDRVYLCGFSSGADFLCSSGLQLEMPVAGSLIVCPGPVHRLAVRADALRRVKAHAFIFVAGEEDYIGKIGAWQGFLALEKAGGRTMYREVQRLGHGFPSVADYIVLFQGFERLGAPVTETDFLKNVSESIEREDYLLVSTQLLALDGPLAQHLGDSIRKRGEALMEQALRIPAAESGRAYEAWWRLRTQFHHFPGIAGRAGKRLEAIERSMTNAELYRVRGNWFENRRVAAGGEPSPAFNRRVNTLINKLGNEPDRQASRDQILAIGKAATPAMLKRMKDPEFTVRWEMVNIQGYMRDEAAIEAVVERVVNDRDPHVRWRAMWALNQYPDTTMAQELVRELSKSTDEVQRWNAFVGMSMFYMPECLPAMHKGLRHADSWRRWEAINALARVNDESSAAGLRGVLASSEKRHRREAITSLGKIPGEEAYNVLAGAVVDRDPGVRFRACMALGKRGDRRAVKVLTERRAVERDKQVLEYLTKALEQLE
ncbi:MAG: HEAT repeat domain-containing protein [Lentisphaeria bacterium]|jgi:HEAT repeat protein/poly(3-hydroxybutyrate) depolymerase|nr:HEAT repeat domain-containing protein [Lentisphaeria bacterium]